MSARGRARWLQPFRDGKGSVDDERSKGRGGRATSPAMAQRVPEDIHIVDPAAEAAWAAADTEAFMRRRSSPLRR